jgi:hypothetical protein
LRLSGHGSVLIGDDFDFAAGAPFSIELWLYVDSFEQNPGIVLDKMDPGDQGGFMMDCAAAPAMCAFRMMNAGDGGMAWGGGCMACVPQAAWSHVVFTFDGVKMSSCLDGACDCGGSVGVALVDTTAPLRLGSLVQSVRHRRARDLRQRAAGEPHCGTFRCTQLTGVQAFDAART